MLKHEGKNYLTPNEAARLLSIHIATVYSWCRHREVELLDPLKILVPVASKYLIEEASIRARHNHVYLDAK